MTAVAPVFLEKPRRSFRQLDVVGVAAELPQLEEDLHSLEDVLRGTGLLGVEDRIAVLEGAAAAAVEEVVEIAVALLAAVYQEELSIIVSSLQDSSSLSPL